MVTAILLAAGTGSRMGQGPLPKQFFCVGGVPILAHTLTRFERVAAIDQIILVTRPQDRARCEQILAEYEISKIDTIVAGGKERQDSVWQGLQAVHPQTEIVLIHDVVRMFVTSTIITDVIEAAHKHRACVTAVPVKDTIKRAERHYSDPNNSAMVQSALSEEFFVVETLDRRSLWQIHTPQAFQYPFIRDIHEQARNIGLYGTDDAMLTEYFGYPVNIVQGSYRNIKITTPDDLLIAETFLQHEGLSSNI
ncbi:2-C-methyl-D-erythritol 4-phosphate cytidylyltransferase [Candidatus Vecturithrix granuli]|uniref:2-C-methyl-D-erythritol 4-phosphate cytidylyltransferase n=1 Tax=Vecturithrix granuli TaxID=1499967 RepID=A0A0S6WA88_VECG1|nr:2-C-methyl-D-erythritol 4-phosphate cytidylyltransferase [Candidatus Vecturithrix granuli]